MRNHRDPAEPGEPRLDLHPLGDTRHRLPQVGTGRADAPGSGARGDRRARARTRERPPAGHSHILDGAGLDDRAGPQRRRTGLMVGRLRGRQCRRSRSGTRTPLPAPLPGVLRGGSDSGRDRPRRPHRQAAASGGAHGHRDRSGPGHGTGGRSDVRNDPVHGRGRFRRARRPHHLLRAAPIPPGRPRGPLRHRPRPAGRRCPRPPLLVRRRPQDGRGPSPARAPRGSDSCGCWAPAPLLSGWWPSAASSRT